MNMNSDARNLEVQSQIAAESVSQLFSQAKAELTPIEASLWTREIDKFGPLAMLSFVEFWISGGGQNAYRRAPRLEDFWVRTDPNYVGAETAVEWLRAEVAKTGPYLNPEIADYRLRASIVRLGGWAKVCQDMPDPSDDFAYKRFTERFRAAWVYAEALQVQKKLDPPALLGLIAAPTQLLLVAGDSSDVALPAPSGN